MSYERIREMEENPRIFWSILAFDVVVFVLLASRLGTLV
jgi:hypothetical protein